MTGMQHRLYYCLLILLFFFTTPNIAHANDRSLYDQYPLGVAYFYGITGSDALGSIVVGQFHRWPEHIQSLELTYTVPQGNIFRFLFKPLTNVLQISANITQRVGHNQAHIYEFNPYFEARWADFPWDQYILTSFAIGEGISYATSVPALEASSDENSKRLLNYLMLEASFASPNYKRLHLFVRIHHRSGMFGVYHAGNTGSNSLGLGIRYLFD
jgi:hypothetical protein